MFARLFALLPLALLASASHLEARQQCNTANQYCCNSVQTYSKSTQLLAQRNIVLGDIAADTPLGFGCSPLGVVAVNGNSCTQQTVCCKDNNFNGVVNVGCTPLNVNA